MLEFVLFNYLIRCQFVFVACGILSLHGGVQDLELWRVNSSLGHVGSGSLTGDGTQVPSLHSECGVLASGPPGKSYSYFTDEETKYEGGWLTLIVFELFHLHYIKQGLPGWEAVSTWLTAETRPSAPHSAALDELPGCPRVRRELAALLSAE